jgi:hypothetical protein
MNREFQPTSRLLRSIFVACALTVTIGLAAFIDLLASDRAPGGANAALPASTARLG